MNLWTVISSSGLPIHLPAPIAVLREDPGLVGRVSSVILNGRMMDTQSSAVARDNGTYVEVAGQILEMVFFKSTTTYGNILPRHL
jgi:hypothetical protein